MKKALLIISAAIVLLLTAFPAANESAPPATESQWTIMIYMGGGYDNNIADALPYDLAEIERAGYHKGFNIVVLKDGVDYGDSQCLVLIKDGLFQGVPLNSIDPSWGTELEMSDPHVLMEFVDWSLTQYPAKHSMLVLWGHGRGWMGMPDDEGNGVMSIENLSLAMKEVDERHGKLDVVGFDQCNMAMFEVFYQISPYADYAVASEKEEDIAGWPYDRLLLHIYSMDNPDGRNVSMQVVRDYVSWAAKNSRYSATMSALNLTRLNSLSVPLSGYARTLRHMLPYYKENITVARSMAESYGALPYPYDLVDLTEKIDENIDFPPLEYAGEVLIKGVENSVILEMHHTNKSDMSVEEAHGIGIWFPGYGSRADYDKLRAYNTGWSLFLEDYFSAVQPEERGPIYLNVKEEDANSDGANESFTVSAHGNGTLGIEIYENGRLMKSTQGHCSAELGFQWGAGYFTVVSYLLNGTSIENFRTSTGIIEKNFILSGELNDFMGQPSEALVELRTSSGNFSTEARGHYMLKLKAPEDFMPGETATLSVCSGGTCQQREIVMNGSSLSENFHVSGSPGWSAYLAGFSVFVAGVIGYVLLFDNTRAQRRAKSFKRTRKLKRIKKVIWVKEMTDRQEELKELKDALEMARNGQGRTIFLTGEEGVGKRTLMEKFRQETGVKSVFYECRGSDNVEPYEPVKKIVAMLKDMGMIKGDTSALFSKGSREEIFESAFQMVKGISSDDAFLVAVFDAQWLDAESIELIKYVARGLSETKALFIISAPQEELEDRNGAPHPLNMMLMELMMEGRVRMVKLERFNPEKTGEMLKNILGKDIPPESVEKIYEMTKGLPLMIQEVAITIKKSGSDLEDPDNLEIEVPSTVKELVARRQSKMDDEEREVAGWGAVLGNSFRYEELRELSSVEDLDKVLYSLIEDRIIVEEGGIYSFDHPEIRNGILESLGDRRKEMHLKAGNMLERLGTTDYDLAYQFCEAGDGERCVRYSLMAAEDAETTYAYKSAIEYYEKALKFLNEGKAPEVYLSMATDYNNLMKYEKAIECAEKVIYSEAPEEYKYRAYSIIGRIQLENQNWEEAREMYETLMKSPDTSMKVDAYRGMGKIYWRLGKHELALENLEKAISLAEKMDDMLLAGSMKVDLANIYNDKGNHQEAEKLYLEAIDIMKKQGAFLELGRIYNNLGEVYRYADKIDKAVDAYQKCIEYSRKSNSINIYGYGVENLGITYASLGKVKEAKKYLEEARKIFNKTGNKYMISGIYMAYGMIYKKEGRWDEADESFTISEEMLKEIDIKYDLAISYLEHARMLKEKGDGERALEMYDKAREIFESIGSEDHLRKIGEETEALR